MKKNGINLGEINMKNITIIYSIIIFCICNFVACNHEDDFATNSKIEKHVTIRAGIIDDSNSRIAFGESTEGKTKVLWSASDVFSLINGKKTYTFNRFADDTEEVAIANFSYSGTETLPDLSTEGLSFCYPATGIPTNYAYQTGTEKGLSDYMVMTATVPEGASWNNLHLSFKHNTAVVKITLTNKIFKDKDVTISLNATGLLENGTFIKSNALIPDESGTVTAYFAVPATNELSDCNITALCDGTKYNATLGAKAITAGKLYTIKKTADQLTTSHFLPTGKEFYNKVVGPLEKNWCTKIKFVTESSQTSDEVLCTDENFISSYIIINGDWLEIHTEANEFVANSDCEYMFRGAVYSHGGTQTRFSKITEIIFSKNFNTENVTNMGYMFHCCEKLTSLDLDVFDTKNVTNMQRMFFKCEGLTSLDLGNFNTENVTNMQGMFYYCTNLSTLNVSSFNTKNVTNMAEMFKHCDSLTRLSLKNFNTNKVTDMNAMFWSDYSLTSLDLSNFNTENVTNMGAMFGSCKKLDSLEIDNFNTKSVTNMSSMFNGCLLLKNINLSHFNTENVTDMSAMFYECKVLEKIDLRNFAFVKSPSVTLMLNTLNSNKTTVIVDESGYDYLTITTTDCGSNYVKFVKSDEIDSES